jgi:hypothetical protein
MPFPLPYGGRVHICPNCPQQRNPLFDHGNSTKSGCPICPSMIPLWVCTLSVPTDSLAVGKADRKGKAMTTMRVEYLEPGLSFETMPSPNPYANTHKGIVKSVFHTESFTILTTTDNAFHRIHNGRMVIVIPGNSCETSQLVPAIARKGCQNPHSEYDNNCLGCYVTNGGWDD